MADELPERQHHAIDKEFALLRKFCRQSVQNQVKIQLTGNGDIKAGHREEFNRFGLPEHDDTAEMPWTIGIKTLAETGVQAQQLSDKKIRRHTRQLGKIKAELN